MKTAYKIFLSTSCVLIILMVTLSGCRKQITEKPAMPSVYLYRFETPSVNPEEFKSLVAQLINDAATPGVFSENKEYQSLQYSDEKSDTYFERSSANGNFSFNRNMQKYLGAYRPSLPSQGEAEQMAMRYLEQNTLMPRSRGEMKLLHSGGLRADSPDGEVIDKMRTLTFGRTVDSLPVVGSGSRIIVHVGDKGEVTGMVRKWRELSGDSKKSLAPEEMISADEAEKKFRSSVEQEFGKNVRVTINKQQLIYYDGDGNYLQPAYGFESTLELNLSDSVKNKIPYLGLVQALKESPESINLLEISREGTQLLKKSDDQKGSANSPRERD